MLRGRISGVAVALLATLLALPSGAVAAEKAIWGPGTLPSGASAFPTYAGLGVDTWQATLDWAAVAPQRPADPANPSDPAYRWPAELDRAILAAGSARVNVALLVTRSPAWANGGRSAIHAPDPGAYAQFVAAASRRYPSVRRWMIWGEPNRADRFQPNSADGPQSARAYAPILDAAYGALKGVSRRNIVIGGMTWTGGDVKPAPFMSFMRLPNGRPPRLDWFGHNPFPFRFPNLRELAISGGFRDVSDLDTFQRQMRRTFGKRTRFWLSEFLVLSDRPSKTFRLAVSREAQARWLRAAYGIADSLDSVAGLGWFSLLDDPPGEGSSNWGLLTASGTPKPSLAAYRNARSERLRPTVRIGGGKARLAVRVRVRVGGRVTLVLRRGRRRIIRMRRTLRRGSPRTIVLGERPRRRGRYVLSVQAPRGATVRRAVSIR